MQQDLIIAVIGFVLGLVGSQVERLLSRERRRVSYSISSRSIIAVDRSLPDDLVSGLSLPNTANLTRYTITATNTGKKDITEATAIIVPEADGRIRHERVTTSPRMGIPYEVKLDDQESDGSFEVTGISLKRRHEVTLEVLVESTQEPRVEVYWSGGGEEATFERTGELEDRGLDGHIAGALYNWIASEVAPAALSSVALLSGLAVYSAPIDPDFILPGASGAAGVVGVLLRAYFLLRIVPHALAITRILRHRGSRLGQTVEIHGGAERTYVVAHGDLNIADDKSSLSSAQRGAKTDQ